MFLDENYLLENATAKTIFAAIKDLPVVDAHNHADVKSLMKNECYTDMWQLFAATDHYVWETMRKCGIDEEYITGSASNHDKFMKLAEAFPLIAEIILLMSAKWSSGLMGTSIPYILYVRL